MFTYVVRFFLEFLFLLYRKKFNPDQFEIIKFRKGDDEKDLCINGKCPYFRILIKNKKSQK